MALLHQRAVDAMPQLSDAPTEGECSRGPKKGRILLHYLRQHLEELWSRAAVWRDLAAQAVPPASAASTLAAGTSLLREATPERQPD